MSINVFWDVVSFRLVNVNQCFGGTSVNINQATWCHIPNGNNLHYSLLLDPLYFIIPIKQFQITFIRQDNIHHTDGKLQIM